MMELERVYRIRDNPNKYWVTFYPDLESLRSKCFTGMTMEKAEGIKPGETVILFQLSIENVWTSVLPNHDSLLVAKVLYGDRMGFVLARFLSEFPVY